METSLPADLLQKGWVYLICTEGDDLIFGDINDILSIGYLHKYETVSWEYYANLLRQLGNTRKTDIRTMLQQISPCFRVMLCVTVSLNWSITLHILWHWLPSVPQHEQHLAGNVNRSDVDVIYVVHNYLTQQDNQYFLNSHMSVCREGNTVVQLRLMQTRFYNCRITPS